ncbi:MAG: rRNA maturation RNase YbeY [Hyphomicrobiaceae bacterium]
MADAAELVRSVAGAVAAMPQLKPDFAEPATACVAFNSDDAVRALNARYRGQDKPTNVLSFPSGPVGRLPQGAPTPLGDIVLADGVVRREAQERGLALSDHVKHLVVHGILHLIGFDHEEDGEAEEMEAMERDVLARLGVADPYQESE